MTHEENARQFGEGNRCVHWRGEWYCWTGSHYSRIGQTVFEKRVLDHLAEAGGGTSRAAIRHVCYHLKLANHREFAGSPEWLDTRQLPNASNLLVAANGLVDLSVDPKLLGHDPELFAIGCVGYVYDAEADCPRWSSFLREVLDDEGSIQLLQEWFGYALLPDTSKQKYLSIVGPPRSGKSTIARVLTGLVGQDAVANPSMRDLSSQFGLWGLLNKRLAIVPDAVLPRPCPAVEELLKSVTGEDSVDVHRKGLPPVTGVRLPVRFMLLANEEPAFQDVSGALRIRRLLLHTRRSFVGEENLHLTDQLLAERPGILNWAIAGLRRLRQRGAFIAGSPVEITMPTATTNRVILPQPSRLILEYDGGMKTPLLPPRVQHFRMDADRSLLPTRCEVDRPRGRR